MNGTGFEELEHPSDIGINFSGRTVEELFENAGLGMFSLITDITKVPGGKKINIKLSSAGTGLEELLILWLEKLLYIFEVEGIIVSRLDVKRVSSVKNHITLEAEARGAEAGKGEQEIINIIKAPTYHLLRIEKDERSGVWNGTVIFDV